MGIPQDLIAWSLQWGHLLSAVETSFGAGQRGPCVSCFNGATSFRRWKHGDRIPGPRAEEASMGPPPSGGGNLGNLAERDDNLGHASMGPPPSGGGNSRTCRTSNPLQRSFNGATAFRKWKLPRVIKPLSEFRVASMGPPPFGSGNSEPIRSIDAPMMPMLQWGHLLPAVETWIQVCLCPLSYAFLSLCDKNRSYTGADGVKLRNWPTVIRWHLNT